MTIHRCMASALLVALLLAPPLWAQSKITIAAGTPEDQDLQAISNQSDAQKRTAMLEEFVQKFSANPAAVAYGNWQLAQQYAAGDPRKALAYGDKALAAMPDVVEILVSQTEIAQQLKDSSKVVDYAVRGATVIAGIDKSPKPAEMTPEDFANQVAAQKEALKPSYRYMEVAAYNAITAEQDARKRMPKIEKYLGAFPESQFGEALATLAVVTLQEMKDAAALAAFGDKMLAKNPNDIRLLTVLASAYASNPDQMAKAGTYARRAVELQKTRTAAASATDRKLAGVAHFVLGRALLQESKFPAAAAELKTATALLQDAPEDLAGAWYYLGFAYAKMERAADAISALTQAGNIQGPYQKLAQELLAKIKAARSRK
jgi:tetratricopeptide (TPR) repeat protein